MGSPTRRNWTLSLKGSKLEASDSGDFCNSIRGRIDNACRLEVGKQGMTFAAPSDSIASVVRPSRMIVVGERCDAGNN